MQINNVDPAIKAGAVGAAIGASLSLGSNIREQHNIINKPDEFIKAADTTKSLLKDNVFVDTNNIDKLVKVAETGKYDKALIAKNTGKAGLIMGSVFAFGNAAYRAITNKG